MCEESNVEFFFFFLNHFKHVNVNINLFKTRLLFIIMRFL